MPNTFQSIDNIHQSGIPTVFLPGWGFDGRILRLVHPAPSWLAPRNILDPEKFEQSLMNEPYVIKSRIFFYFREATCFAMLDFKLAALF